MQVTFLLGLLVLFFKEKNMKFIKKIIAKFILLVWGWKIVLEGPASNLDRCVLVVAPHTANDEYILGNLAYWVLDKKLKVIIKMNLLDGYENNTLNDSSDAIYDSSDALDDSSDAICDSLDALNDSSDAFHKSSDPIFDSLDAIFDSLDAIFDS